MKLGDYLTIWAEWMKADDGPEQHRAVAIGFDNAQTNYHIREDDPDIQAERREAGYGPIIDACIESLRPHERLAIHQVFGFSRHIRMTGLNAGIVMTECLPRLAAMVRKRLPLDDELTPDPRSVSIRPEKLRPEYS